MFTVQEQGYKVGDLVRIDERFNPDHGKVGTIVTIFDQYTVEVDLGKNAMSNLFKVDSICPATLADWKQHVKKEQPKRVRGFELCKGYEDYQLPLRKTKYSAGYDFYAPCDILIPAHGYSDVIQTGVKAYMKPDEVLLLNVRSSIGIKFGVVLAQCQAVIDADFVDNPENEGNISFKLHNTSDVPVFIKKGDRVLQGIFVKYLVADNCNSDEERKGGIGSTNG